MDPNQLSHFDEANKLASGTKAWNQYAYHRSGISRPLPGSSCHIEASDRPDVQALHDARRSDVALNALAATRHHGGMDPRWLLNYYQPHPDADQDGSAATAVVLDFIALCGARSTQERDAARTRLYGLLDRLGWQAPA